MYQDQNSENSSLSGNIKLLFQQYQIVSYEIPMWDYVKGRERERKRVSDGESGTTIVEGNKEEEEEEEELGRSCGCDR